MKQLLKPYLVGALGAADVFPVRQTDRTVIQALLKRLNPIDTDRGLIRLGPDGDGGYLVPDDLTGIQACFSPGVSSISGFEMDCARRGMRVYLADKSVDGPAGAHELFHFTKRFVGSELDEDFMTMEHWVKNSGESMDKDLLLQIDIEGFEYETFINMSNDLLNRFRIIVAEFHSLDQLWNKPFHDLSSRAFDKILSSHSCVHIHPNNCCGELAKSGITIPRVAEFTFLRNDRIRRRSARRDFPHPLDRHNVPSMPPLRLSADWYGEPA